MLLIASYPKGFLVLWFNDHYSIFWKIFFKYLTYLGDGAIVGLLALVLLFVRYYWFAVVALMGLMQLVVVQGLKNFIFGATPRPAAFFENYEPPLQFVEGVNIHHLFSIPSGHTTTAFSVAFILILLLNTGKLTTVLLFILALLTGLSRIYLAQHFLADVLLGALIGTLMARIAYWVGEHFRNKNPDAPFFQKSLKDLI
jgi:membrane-associated phospholipid phosphatase